MVVSSGVALWDSGLVFDGRFVVELVFALEGFSRPTLRWLEAGVCSRRICFSLSVAIFGGTGTLGRMAPLEDSHPWKLMWLWWR